MVGIDQRLADNFGEPQIGELAFGGDSFALRPRGDSGELIAGLFFVRFGEHLAEIGEYESLSHKSQADGSCVSSDAQRNVASMDRQGKARSEPRLHGLRVQRVLRMGLWWV